MPIANESTTAGAVAPRIVPWLSAADATQAVEYYKAAFGAIEIERLEGAPNRVEVAQLSIAGALFWVQRDDDSNPELLKSFPCTKHTDGASGESSIRPGTIGRSANRLRAQASVPSTHRSARGLHCGRLRPSSKAVLFSRYIAPSDSSKVITKFLSRPSPTLPASTSCTTRCSRRFRSCAARDR